MKMCANDTQIAAVLRQLMCFSLISHPAHARAVGSSRQRCGVCWCRVYRVIPKRAIRTARTTQMLTRMAEILPSRRVSQSEPCDKIIRRHSTEEAPAFLAAEFRDYFCANILLPRLGVIPTRFRTASINMGSEFRYEMAHEQRVIFERQHCRGYLQADPTERARSFPRYAGS